MVAAVSGGSAVVSGGSAVVSDGVAQALELIMELDDDLGKQVTPTLLALLLWI